MGGQGGTCPPILSKTGPRGASSSRAPIGVRRACGSLGLPWGVAFVLSRVCHGGSSAEAAGLLVKNFTQES